MTIKLVEVQRFSVVSAKPFKDVLTELDAAIGHPNLAAFLSDITSTKTYTDLQDVIQNAVGASGLMEFARFDLGEILRRKLGERA